MYLARLRSPLKECVHPVRYTLTPVTKVGIGGDFL